MGVANRTIIDAKQLILGRMASTVAKRLLEGEYIEIINAEDAIVSGKRLQIIKDRKEFLEIGGRGRGPIHWRRPNTIVRRTIRGMIPYRKSRGREAFRRLRVHIGVPKRLADREKESILEARASRLGGRYVTIGEIAENIGWKQAE
jgi:large subunit ribosomal protein L13